MSLLAHGSEENSGAAVSMSGGGGVSGAASSEGLSGEGGSGSAEWRRMYDRIEAHLPRVAALAADRVRLEALDRTQRNLSGARENDLHARLVQAEASRTRWKKAYIDLPLLADPKIIELKEKDLEDSRKREALFDHDNPGPEIQLMGAGRHVELSETNIGDEDIVRDLRAELTKLKQASETLSTNKDKEAIEVAQKLQQNIGELQVAARKKDDAIARLRVEAVDAKNKLRAMEKDHTALVKINEVEGAQAIEATHKFQKKLEELQVAARDKDDEIRRLAAEALAAKNKLLVAEDEIQKLKDGQIVSLKRKRASLSNESSLKHRRDANAMHLEQRRMAGSLLNADIDRKHRSTLLAADPGSLKHLVTRTPMSNWMIHPDWLQRLKWAGLLPFVRLVEATRTQEIEGRQHGFQTTRLHYDGSLLTCLVDRWRPETHTFHFRWGEMAPTLQDVSFLLGLPLAGVPMGPVDAPANWAANMAQRFLGIREGVTPFTYENHGPKFDWLQNYQIQKFGYPAVLMTEPQITRSLEAYIMWLLGKVMFTENHVSTISARYIHYARQIADATCQNDITQWSWGSAVLAATYRGMCMGCTLTKDRSALLGCPMLLQLWSWERFPIGRPEIIKNKAIINKNEAPVVYESDLLFDQERIDMPTFGTHWTRRKCRFAGEQVKSCYPVFSEQFDTLREDSVIWEPYTTVEIAARYSCGLSIMCTRDEDYWLTKSKIIFDCQVEEMSQQRVMRQFGLCQMVDPPRPEVPLSEAVHMYSRKGTNKSAAQWLQRVNIYMQGLQNATTDLWLAGAFDMELFRAYLHRYMAMTRLRPVHHAHDDERYPSQSTMEPRQSAANMTWELQNEVHQWGRSLSSAPLVPNQQAQSFVKRVEERLRSIYATITCTNVLDVVQHRAAQRPLRHSMQERPSCHSTQE